MKNKILQNKSSLNAVVVNINPYPYLVTGEELLKNPITQIPFLWSPFFIQQGLIALTGASDVGKSSLLRQFAISVVLKEKIFLGTPLNVRYGRALYLATEDNTMIIGASLAKSLDAKIKPMDLKDLCYLINPDNPLKDIEDQLKIAKTDVVIIDSFADIFIGNLNDNNAVRAVLNKYQKLSEKYDTLIIFLHHTGKNKENNNPSKNNIIGSQGFEAKMRLTMELRKPDSTNKRFLHFTKGNYLPEAQKIQAVELVFDSRQQFQFVGNYSSINAKSRNYTDEEKKEIMTIVKPLREKGISIDHIIELQKGNEDFPSKGTLHKWLKEKEDSQSE